MFWYLLTSALCDSHMLATNHTQVLLLSMAQKRLATDNCNYAKYLKHCLSSMQQGGRFTNDLRTTSRHIVRQHLKTILAVKVKVSHTRLASLGFRSWSRFRAVSLDGDTSHPLLTARPAVTLATLNRAATNFAAWWTQARWVWTVCLRLLPDSVAAAIWTQALLRLSPAR